MPEEILEILLEDVFTKAEHEYQQREYNYVFEVTTWDPETGEVIMDHEFRTLATNEFLSDEDALSAFEDFFGDAYGVEAGA